MMIDIIQPHFTPLKISLLEKRGYDSNVTASLQSFHIKYNLQSYNRHIELHDRSDDCNEQKRGQSHQWIPST